MFQVHDPVQNKRLIYNLLFHASAETLLEIAREARQENSDIAKMEEIGPAPIDCVRRNPYS